MLPDLCVSWQWEALGYLMGGFAVFGLIGLAAVYNDKPSKKPYVSRSCQHPVNFLDHTAACSPGLVPPCGMLCWWSLLCTASCSPIPHYHVVSHVC